MKCKTSFALAMLLLVTMALYLHGCSVCGLAVGTMIDRASSDSLKVSLNEIDRIKPGKNVRVLLHSGEQLTGRYLGYERFNKVEYARMYNEFREQQKDSVYLPKIGEEIEIVYTTGKRMKGEFLSFDWTAPSNQKLWIQALETGRSQPVFFRHVDSLSNNRGDNQVGEVLRELASQNRLPFLSAVDIYIPPDTTRVAINRVKQIELKKKKTGRWIGLGFGAAVDVFFIVVGIVWAASDGSMGIAN
jgi:hypothetical protein